MIVVASTPSAAPRSTRRRARVALIVVVGALLAALAWAAFAPLPSPSNREHVFVIPAGTWQRRMDGEAVEILPSRIVLTLGVRDVLTLVNRDAVPQTFGPALLMPGQTFRLPFEQASEYSFACSAHASGEMTVVVEPFPASPWARLRWRAGQFLAGRDAAAGLSSGERSSMESAP